MPPDFDPFVTMPAGTVVRDLPDGGRLFTLADGVMVRVGPDGRLTAIGMDGSVALLEPARGGVVTLPDGRELTLKPEAVRMTHEAAGIEGLPWTSIRTRPRRDATASSCRADTGWMYSSQSARP